jgi:DNA-binding transcriptional LysR family regulator
MDGGAGELRIGFTAASSLLSFFPSIVHAFRIKYPEVRVILSDMPRPLKSPRCRRESSMRELFARRRVSNLPRILRRRGFSRIRWWLRLTRPITFTPNAKSICRSCVMSVFYPRSYGIGIYDYVLQLCGKRSFVPMIVQEAREASTIIGLVATGLGIASCPRA